MIQIFFFFSLHSSNSSSKRHYSIQCHIHWNKILNSRANFEWKKRKKRIDKIVLNARKFLVSRPGPLFLSRPGLLPFARLRFPFRFEQLTRVEDALFQKKVQKTQKTPLYSVNSAEIKAEDHYLGSFVLQRVKEGGGASKASPRKLRGGRCCRLFRVWPATSNRFNRRSNRES